MSAAVQPAPGTRVLIVDDEDNQRSGLANMISGWGFVTETARDGVDALEKIDGFDPQVMLTDMMMPRMDGSELMKTLTEREQSILSLRYFAGLPYEAIGSIHHMRAGAVRTAGWRFSFASAAKKASLAVADVAPA